jgi:N-acetylglucosaminyl-diphospho-decaprenol L-rhamnosyltransferase
MTLSICIVNWNTRDYLKACLASIDAHPPHSSFEIIVVDNASRDGSEVMVRERFPHVRLIANSENRNYAAGNNQALQAAQGEFQLLLNPDTEVYENSLDRAVAFFQSHPEAGAIGALQRFPNGEIQPSVRAFPYPLLLFFEMAGLSKLFPRHPLFAGYRMGTFRYDLVQEVDQPMGTFLMVRRDVIEQVGLLDENFPLFFNDVDWCYRIRQADWKIYFVPEVVILHHGGAGTRQIRRAAIRESHRALERFYRKHFRKRVPAPVFGLIIGLIRFGAWLRLLRAKA